MSKSTSPRVLKLKKLPKGKFKWKVDLFKEAEFIKELPHWERYYSDYENVSKECLKYLKENMNGKVYLKPIKSTKLGLVERNRHKLRVDYILFENQFDVTMFKLCWGSIIRQIYRIEVEEKPA